MAQQTAVEWLEQELKDRYPLMNSEPFFEQAKQIEKEQSTKDQHVTRFEVIDHSGDKPGRVLVKYGVNVEMSIQDDDKTLKIFLTDENK